MGRAPVPAWDWGEGALQGSKKDVTWPQATKQGSCQDSASLEQPHAASGHCSQRNPKNPKGQELQGRNTHTPAPQKAWEWLGLKTAPPHKTGFRCAALDVFSPSGSGGGQGRAEAQVSKEQSSTSPGVAGLPKLLYHTFQPDFTEQATGAWMGQGCYLSSQSQLGNLHVPSTYYAPGCVPFSGVPVPRTQARKHRGRHITVRRAHPRSICPRHITL